MMMMAMKLDGQNLSILNAGGMRKPGDGEHAV